MAVDSEPEPSSIASERSRSALLRWRRAIQQIGHKTTIGGIALVLLASCTGRDRDAAGPSVSAAGLATVVHVVDGDTIDVELAGSVTERVRLIGIDTPESVSRSTPVQCYGAEATEALRSLLPEDTVVRLERDLETRDRYGRLLAYVHRFDDDLFVNRWMVEHGFANAVFYEPNTTFEADFTALENGAQADAIGLWGSCDGPDQPLEAFPEGATVEP